MIQRLLGLFRRAEPPLPVIPVEELPRVPVEMKWLADTELPIPDWDAIGDREPAGVAGGLAHAYWTSAALSWLEALRDAAGEQYKVRESEDFLLLSSMEDRPAQLCLATCERMLVRISRSLGPLANDAGWGKYVLLVFDDADAYYSYVTHYYPEGGEYAMSSGMFIQAGYGHFVLPLEALDEMEPTIAHELTHSLLSHLPIPAWLNEGLAVNTEYTIFPQLAAPSAQLYFPHEVAAQHSSYWNADTIQTFWSGKSFLQTDEGNRLSYDLARKITALAARDEPSFRAFVAEAMMQDGGVSAEHHLGYPVEHLVEAVLGEGHWRPCPEQWREGVEGGQFQQA